MKKLLKTLKWVGIVLVSVIVLFVAAVFLFKGKTYEAPLPDIKASTDSAIIAKGKSIVYGPAQCATCHADPKEIENVDRGAEAALVGGFEFKLPIGIIRAANLTSDPETGIGKMTDGEIARSLRHAVARDGHAIPDFMPFQNLSDEDLTAVISYLRTLAPVKNKVETMELNFMGDAVKAFMLSPIGPDGTPPKSVTPDSTIEYGKYLVHSVANCRGCHTDRNPMNGAFIGPDFAGGMEFEGVKDPNFKVRPPNITPDKKTGKIATWTQQFFIERFRKGRLVPESPMPWGPFSRMSDLELKAIYRYMRTVTPVERIPGVEPQ